jgi:hypothetical protein
VAIEQFRSDNREPNTNMTAQPKIVQDAVASADQISRALSQSGYKADFSLESPKEVDRFFDEHVTSGKAKPGGLLSQQLGARLFALGSYVGEVIRRHNGGQWQGMTTILKARSILPFACATGQSYGPSSAS